MIVGPQPWESDDTSRTVAKAARAQHSAVVGRHLDHRCQGQIDRRLLYHHGFARFYDAACELDQQSHERLEERESGIGAIEVLTQTFGHDAQRDGGVVELEHRLIGDSGIG
jgi:hypothetical protein